MRTDQLSKSILREQGIGTDRDARRPADMADSRLFDGEEFCSTIRPLVEFLRLPYAVGAKRPSRLFFEVTLGFGREGLLALLSAFEDAGNEIDGNLAKVLARVVMDANRQNIVTWDLSGWRPATVDPAKARRAAYFSTSLAERVRRCAFAGRKSVSSLLTEAAEATVTAMEAQGLSVERPAVEEPMPAVAVPATASPFGPGTIPLPPGIVFRKPPVEAAKGKA